MRKKIYEFNSNYEIGKANFLLSFNKKKFIDIFNKIEGQKSKVYNKNLGILKNQKLSIVDFGCGVGSLIPFYSKLNIKHCYLIDINSKFLKICNKYYNTLTNRNKFKIKKQNIVNVKNFSKFDLVVCTGVLGYLKNSYQKKIITNFTKLSNKYILIEFIRGNSFFSNLFKITSYKIVKKIVLFFLILAYFSYHILFFLKRDNTLIIFFVKLISLLSDLSSNNYQAININNVNFYKHHLQKHKFKLIKKFEDKSLIALLFIKNK